MAVTYNRQRQSYDVLPKSKSRWKQTFLVGVVGAGLFLLFTQQEGTHRATVSLNSPVTTVAPEVAQPSLATPEPQTPRLVPSPLVLESRQPDLAKTENRGQRQEVALVQSIEPVHHVQALDSLTAQFKNMQTLTPENAKEMDRLLKELRKQGVAAVPAIRDFLRSKGDVNYDKMKGGELASNHTLRQALFDTLRQIGSPEAIATLVEELGGNQDPAEIAMLARNLEQAEPGVYQSQILQATSSALQLYARGNQQVEIRPLFEVLKEIGGPQAANILAQYPANATSLQYVSNKDPNISPTVKTYALISLASLPDAEGVNSLAAMAGDPRVPTQYKAELPFQMLAQTAMEHEAAGEALLKLAKGGQIPDRAWPVVSEALQGRYILFPSQMAGGLLPGQHNEVDRSDAEAPFLRGFYDDEKNLKYEQRLVSADWSPEQVQQQQKLIDNLLSVTTSAAGKEALHNARAALQRDRVASLQ